MPPSLGWLQRPPEPRLAEPPCGRLAEGQRARPLASIWMWMKSECRRARNQLGPTRRGAYALVGGGGNEEKAIASAGIATWTASPQLLKVAVASFVAGMPLAVPVRCSVRE
jgi:hypothetical protein